MPPDYKKVKNNPDKKSFPFWKKLKHLRTTFIQFVDERSIAGAWTEELEKDFEIIEQLELDYNIQKRLLPGDMKLCNELYNKYRVVYDST